VRLTAGANWALAAEAAFRRVRWTFQFRKGTTLSDAINSGTWTDATAYVRQDMFPIRSSIEFSAGEFRSDSINITGDDIVWWKANVFDASASQYIEFRVRGYIGISATAMSTDAFFAFSGFVQKDKKPIYDRISNTVKFTVYTADDNAQNISSLNLYTQYYNGDIDGAATAGVMLPKIPNVYVKDAGVTSYELIVGLHTLTYQFNTPNYQMKLDDGDLTTLASATTTTLVNADGTQKIDIYRTASGLSQSVDEITEYIIVTTEGNTLPNNPYYGQSLRTLIDQTYDKMGVTEVAFDTLTFSSHDGERRISFYDVAPMDVSVTGKRSGICSDGTNLYVGVGNKLYKRTASTEAYTLLTTLSSGYDIGKLLYNARNNQIWIMCKPTSYLSADFLRVLNYNLNSSAISGEVTFSGAGTQAASIFDYEYSAGSWKYALIVIDDGISKTYEVTISGTTLTKTEISVSASAYEPISSITWNTGGQDLFWFGADGTDSYVRQVHVNGSGNWVDDGFLTNGITAVNSPLQLNSIAVYDSVADEIIFYSGSVGDIWTWPVNTAPDPTLILATNEVSAMIYADGITVAFCNIVGSNEDFYLYEIESGVATLATDIYRMHPPIGALNEGSNIIYGIDHNGRIFRYNEEIVMFTDYNEYSDETIRSVYTQLLKSFNLIGIINAEKKGRVYRRGNNSGTIQTSGSSVALTASNISDIEEEKNYYPKIDFVTVSNGISSTTYNGTDFGVGFFADAKTLEITNRYIPTYLLKDVAKYFFTFFNTARDLYPIQTNVARMEYEVFDGGAINYTSDQITKAATGVIVAMGINYDGSCNYGVLY